MDSVCLTSRDRKSVIDFVIVAIGIDNEVAKGSVLLGHDQKTTSDRQEVINTSRKTQR